MPEHAIAAEPDVDPYTLTGVITRLGGQIQALHTRLDELAKHLDFVCIPRPEKAENAVLLTDKTMQSPAAERMEVHLDELANLEDRMQALIYSLDR